MLVKSVVSPIADYYMQCHSIPIKVCDSIDKMTKGLHLGINGGEEEDAHS